MRVGFDCDKQSQPASKKKPRITTLEELKVGFFTFIEDNNPTLLECKVEALLRRGGHSCAMDPTMLPIITANRAILGGWKESCCKDV